MSPPRLVGPEDDRAARALTRIAIEAGAAIRAERLRRRWTIRDLAARAGVSASEVYHLESGRIGSVAAYGRIATALGRRLELVFEQPGRAVRPALGDDPVHSMMGELETGQFAGFGLQVAIDEPFQHFQFAGRADVLAWSLPDRALLHIENRTRFPNLQEAAGSYKTKRSYLAGAIAQRLGIRGGFQSVTHVMVVLWSAEVLHVLRLRRATFRAICPDGIAPFSAWWAGTPPGAGAPTSSLIVLDPIDRARSRRFIDLDAALRAEPRYRGYADAANAVSGRRDKPQ
jgi:transcriptional regulator with XRE-family HTH domain